MTYIQAILMGLVQGLTEFLPVSSSAHIVLTSYLYKKITGNDFLLSTSGEAFFDIILHLGTLLAILIYFRKDIIKIIQNFFYAIKQKDFFSEGIKLPIYIVLGTLATMFVVFPLKDLTEKLLYNPNIVGLLLCITGFILIFSEIIYKKYKNKNDKISLKSAILIGLAQGLAIFPGISRSGSTIGVAILLGINKVKAAKYSFLLSVPVILGASLFYPIIEFQKEESLAVPSFGVLAVGFFSAAIIGYLCIKYFIKFLEKFSMNIFAIYCSIVGILMFIFCK